MKSARCLLRCTSPARLLPLLALVMNPALHAQGPPRPELPADADSNDASAYMRLAASRLESDPRKAEQAYIWASRLAPGTAEAAYGRFVANLLGNRERLRRWMSSDERQMRSADMVELDSLLMTAFNMQPFLFVRYDRLLLDAYIQDALEREYGLFDANDPRLQYAIKLYLRQQGSAFNGWLAYTERRHADAIRHYEQALDHSKDRAGLLWNLALAYYQNANVDEAIKALQRAVAERKEKKEGKLTHIYESSAHYEYMTGWALEQKGDIAGAREAYARALLEDLSFHPAHIRLGSIALLEGDTTAALNSIGTAVDIRPDDVWLRWVHGTLLIEASKPDAAIPELKRATELEPVFASPWYELARANDMLDDSAEASRCYREFLQRASASDPRRSRVEARIRRLGGG